MKHRIGLVRLGASIAVVASAIGCAAGTGEESSEEVAEVQVDKDQSALMASDLTACGCTFLYSDGWYDTYSCPNSAFFCIDFGGGGGWGDFGGGGGGDYGSCTSCKSAFNSCSQTCCGSEQCPTMSCFGECESQFIACRGNTSCAMPSHACGRRPGCE